MAGLGAVAAAGLLPSTRSVRLRNSSSSKMGRSFSALTGSRRRASSSKVRGTSVRIVADLLAVTLDFGFESPFQAVGMGQQILDATEVGNEFYGRLFAHTGTARYVVRTVAHQSQYVDDLFGRLDTIFGLDLFGTQYLEIAAELGAVHEDMGRYQLAVVHGAPR